MAALGAATINTTMIAPTQRITCIMFVILCVLFAPSVCFAQGLGVGVGSSLPPYVIPDEARGLEVDIIKEAFALSGIPVEIIFRPNLRLDADFGEGIVDAIAMNVDYESPEGLGLGLFRSDETVTYENYAITVKKDILLASISDLGNYTIVAFDTASKSLGKEYAMMAGSNRNYRELSDQALQVRLLYSGRTQVIISDKNIFLWWRQKLLQGNNPYNLDLSFPPIFHSLFPPAPRCVIFRDRHMRDAFNKGLLKLKRNGRFDELVKEYLSDLQ